MYVYYIYYICGHIYTIYIYMDDPGVAMARSYQRTNMCCWNCALRIYSEVDAARARDRAGSDFLKICTQEKPGTKQRVLLAQIQRDLYFNSKLL